MIWPGRSIEILFLSCWPYIFFLLFLLLTLIFFLSLFSFTISIYFLNAEASLLSACLPYTYLRSKAEGAFPIRACVETPQHNPSLFFFLFLLLSFFHLSLLSNPLHPLSRLVFLVVFQCLLDASTHPSHLHLVISIPMKYDIPTLLALSRNARIDAEKFSSQAASSMCSSGVK